MSLYKKRQTISCLLVLFYLPFHLHDFLLLSDLSSVLIETDSKKAAGFPSSLLSMYSDDVHDAFSSGRPGCFDDFLFFAQLRWCLFYTGVWGINTTASASNESPLAMTSPSTAIFPAGYSRY